MIKQNNNLIAYFSWSGNTQEVAKQIHQLVGGDLFRIQAISDYSSIYNDVVRVARREIKQGEKPKLKESITNLEKYDVVFLAYPNWCNTFPAPVKTFLSENTFNEKIIIPFCTHGGGGTGHSVGDIMKLCPEVEVIEALSINGYAVSNSKDTVNEWLKQLRIVTR